MKANLYDEIKTLVEIQDEFSNQIIPKNTLGTVVECYENPEGYAVDLAIPNANLIGDFEYFNVILHPEQFLLVETSERAVNTIT